MYGFWQLFLLPVVLLIEGKLNDREVQTVDTERWQLSDTRDTGRFTDMQDLAK